MNRAANTQTFSIKPLVGLVSLLCAAPLSAAPIDPDLQTAMTTGADVSYIVQFSERANLTPYENLPHITAMQRRNMLRALRTQALISQQAVKAQLLGKAKKMTSLWSVNALSVTSSPDLVEQIASDSSIESITLDATLTAPVSTLAVDTPAEWNLHATGAPDLWNMGITGSNVVVASLDTGVDLNHPDLRRNWRRGSNSWYDPNGEHTRPYDSSGHGTQTMGIVVGGSSSGNAIGMAPDAQWMAVKIFNDAGVATISSIHQGFQWLLDPDEDINTDDAPNVVNGSWGFTDLVGQCFSEFENDLSLLRTAGINVVLASGNQGPYPDSSVSPANNPSGYAVGAVDSNLDVASISGRGPSACTGGIYPQIVAPGIGIKTSDLTFGGLFPDSYAYVSGTSAAAPHVTGAIALLRQAFPDATVAEIENALAASATDIDTTGADNNAGSGLLNVLDAYHLLSGGGTPVNTPPVAAADSYQVAAGDVLNVAVPGLLGNDSDADGDLLSVDELPLVAPTGGDLTLFPDGSFVYIPAVGTTQDSFTYAVTDGTDTAQALVSIGVTPPVINTPPAPVDDSYSVTDGTTLQVAAPGLLGNDTDADGDSLSVSTTPVVAPANGQLTLLADGGFEYIPDPGAQNDSFVYQVSDGSDSAQATVFITVDAARNNAPIAVDDTFEVGEGDTLSVAAPGLLANDSDADGDPLSLSLTPISGPANGSLSLAADGSFNYTPDAGATSDSFVYEISDGTSTSQALVLISVNPAQSQNTAPLAVADSASMGWNVQDVFIDLTGNDSDVDGNLKDATGNVPAAQISLVNGSSTVRRGSLTVVDNGVLYTPRRNFRGTDYFSYQVLDTDGAVSNTVTVSISVNR